MKKTVKNMFENTDVKKAEIVTDEDIKNLPLAVQEYLRRSNVIGKERIRTVRLKQRGDFRLKPEDDFKTMNAEQYVNIETQEFYWRGKVSVITAHDKFINGRGNMTVKLFGVINVSEMEGKEIDQGELLRFLAEGVWFPTIFVEDFISWEPVDDSSARASITINGITVSALFHFNEKYEVVKITAKRYMEKNGMFTLEEWEIRNKDYKLAGGMLIPNKSEVVWNLKDGPFLWYKPEILLIEYNVTSTF